MKVKSLGTNRTEIATENMRVLVSYETPVAAWIAGQGYVKTDKKWSRTTSKHITQWIGPSANYIEAFGFKAIPTKPQTFFDELLEVKL